MLFSVFTWQTSCGPEVDGDVISGGVIEVNKWGVHSKFRGSSSTVREIWSRVQICNIYKMTDCSRPEVDSDIISGRIEAVLRRTSVPILVTLRQAAHSYLRSPARPPVPCAITIPAQVATLRRGAKI